MDARRISVVGGGPAGLFAARLLKLARPRWELRLYERLPAEDTFGFGVGLSGRTLDAVGSNDPDLADDLVAAAHRYSSGEFRLPGGATEIPGFHSGVAIGRAALLRCLTHRAEQAGVQIELGEAPPVDELTDAANDTADETADDTTNDAEDFVDAADGVGSAVRTALADRFDPQVDVGRGNFFWCGAPVRLAGSMFAPIVTEAGVFTAHAYPYASDRSTFVIEAGDDAIRDAGLSGAVFDSDGASDEPSLAYLSEIFAPVLGGASFIGNRSRWTHFRTVRCARWSAGPVVLLGDAAATAHPTIGSGTKLALESAIALVDTLVEADRTDGSSSGTGTGTVASALVEFERRRRPAVERFQAMARRSQLWWESFEHRLDTEPAVLAAGFLSRTGAVSLDSLRQTGPELARRAAAAFAGTVPADVPAGELASWVLDRPLDRLGVRTAGRRCAPAPDVVAVASGDAWGPSGDAVLAQAQALADSGARVIRLSGANGADDVRDRLAMGERLRAAGFVVQVGGPADLLDELADGLVAGRTDLVCVDDGAAVDRPEEVS